METPSRTASPNEEIVKSYALYRGDVDAIEEHIVRSACEMRGTTGTEFSSSSSVPLENAYSHSFREYVMRFEINRLCVMRPLGR